MKRTFSFRLSALLGKDVILTREFEGYSPGARATVDEFVTTADGSFFRIVFKDIPGTIEEIEPLEFVSTFMLSNSRPLRSFFKSGFPSKDERCNLRVV